MFLHYERFTSAIGWQRRWFEEHIPQVHAHIAEMPGFVSTHFLRDDGDLTHYLALRAWENREAELKFNVTPWYQEYLKTRSMEAYLRPNFVEFFDLMNEVKGKAQAKVAVEVQVDVADRAAWTPWEQELHKMLPETPGFSSMRLYSFLGNLNRYLRVSLWEDRDAILDFHETKRRMDHDLSMRQGMLHSSTNRFYTVMPGGTIVP